MTSDAEDIELTKRYLLGDGLTAEEQESVESLLVEDDSFLDLLTIVEEELVECYLCNDLVPGQRQLFEKRLAISPRLRHRLKWVKLHLQSSRAARGSRVFGSPPSLSSWWKHLYALRIARNGRALATAALGITLVAAALLWIRRGERELENRIAQERARADQFAGQLEHVRAELRRLPQGIIASIALTPEASVRTGQEPATRTRAITLHPETAVLRVQLLLTMDLYNIFQGSLQTIEGEEILHENGLKSEQSDRGHAVNWALPTSSLPDNDYIIILRGRTATGALKPVASYYFRLRRDATSPVN
jgi:hypothetical protein